MHWLCSERTYRATIDHFRLSCLCYIQCTSSLKPRPTACIRSQSLDFFTISVVGRSLRSTPQHAATNITFLDHLVLRRFGLFVPELRAEIPVAPADLSSLLTD